MVGGHPRERTALIVTVLDEAGTIDALLESIACQTCPADEVVIVDGGSRDGTWERLQAWRARLRLVLLQAPGAGISRGRNLAIQATTCDAIAVTDAGVRLEPDWLEQLLAKLRPGVDVVSGFFRAEPQTDFEWVMGATVLPAIDDIDPEKFLPSSRSVLFRRAAWRVAGGYPEWLDYCEDLVFDLALRAAGCTFAFAPGAVAWFRPRSSLRAFFRQYFFYSRGDGKADLWRLRHAVRYATYAAAILLLRRGGALGVALLVVGGLAYTRRPYTRLHGVTPYGLVCVPAIRLVGDIAKMLGYPVGVWWRIRRRWTSPSSS